MKKSGSGGNSIIGKYVGLSAEYRLQRGFVIMSSNVGHILR